ncbi:MAG: NAD(P)-dependent oxidoreductase [Anaerolineae bacterium]|nr:NAD(P)-dependent oxidoreductase [Anaerolineae bacterium]
MTDEIIASEPLTIFITGAITPTGQALTRLLRAQGHQVTGVVNSSQQADNLRSAGGTPAYPDLYRAGEIRSAIAGTNAKIVVNLEPQVPNHPPQIDADWDLQIAAATSALLEAAEAVGVEYLVHTSYAFADAHAGEGSEEARPFLKAVRAAEHAVQESPVPACVLRFGTLYGAESPDLMTLFDTIKAGRSVHPGFPHPTHWLYAADAAAAINAAIHARPTKEILTVTDGHPASAVDFIQYFCEAQGLIAPDKPPRFAFRRPFNSLHEAVQHLHYEAGNEVAKEKLGWSPRFTSYKHGIDDLLITWRAMEPVVS